MIALILFSFALILVSDIPDLVRVKNWKDTLVFSVIFVTGLVISILLYAGIQLPSPVTGFRYLYEDVFKLSYKNW